jgi:hypothetical protein
MSEYILSGFKIWRLLAEGKPAPVHKGTPSLLNCLPQHQPGPLSLVGLAGIPRQSPP